MVQNDEDITLNFINKLKSDSVTISDDNKLLVKLQALRKAGTDALQLIFDFDQTISKQHVNGERQVSSFGKKTSESRVSLPGRLSLIGRILALCKTVPKDFLAKNRGLAEKYYPIEMDPNLTKEEKLPHIIEWYTVSQQMFNGLVFDEEELKLVARMSELRNGTNDLFRYLSCRKIPTLVLSAGLGDVIRAVLQGHDIHESEYFHIISNFFKRQDGTILGYGNLETGEFIHPYNKNGLGCTEYFKKLGSTRKNVILLGDTIGDSNMDEGVPQVENTIKIGFLYGTPTHITQSLPSFSEAFDIVLKDDQTMHIPQSIIEFICSCCKMSELDVASEMEVEYSNKNVMASSGTVGSVSVSLHPLVIMNISEHWTRLKAQSRKPQQVFGAVIGKQKGRHLEIMNSFELLYTVVDNNVVIDKEYYNMKEEQFKQVFSDLDFLGWYTSGDAPDCKDIHVHKQICEIYESPVLLKLNPMARQSDLPVTLYESVIDLLNGEATMLFVQLSYTLATEEAERIGVDHVARVSTNEAVEVSLVAEHLTAQHSAIKMLHSRVKLVLDYVKAVENGTLPATPQDDHLNHHEILREAYSLSHRLPVLQTPQFTSDLYNQCNDVGLMAYLGAMNKGCYDINQLINRFNVIYDRQGMGRRMRGMFF